MVLSVKFARSLIAIQDSGFGHVLGDFHRGSIRQSVKDFWRSGIPPGGREIVNRKKS